MWMSSGGTSSHLHYDADHNLHCLITGRKDFIMYDPKHMDRFDMKVFKVPPNFQISKISFLD